MNPVRRVISIEDPLILGSASPRRSEILKGLGIPFLVRPANIPEDPHPGEAPEPYVERIVAEKLAAVQKLLGAETSYAAVLVADTVVVIDEEPLGKPTDIADAVRILSKIVGREHRVLTRYAVAPIGGPAFSRTVRSDVILRDATDTEIHNYARSGEGLDKAGAYAAQGIGAFLVRAIRGSYSNVVGLPACEVVEDLRDQGLLEGYPALE